MECEICQNPWNTENRIPKILPCGHSFCLSCLKELFKNHNSQQNIFKCPSCKNEITFLTYNDVLNLRNNNDLISLIGKMEIQKIKTNTSNASMSNSLQINNSSNINNDINNNNLQNEENILNLKKNNSKKKKKYNNFINNYFPMCLAHKSKANFYEKKNNNIIYICNDCLQINEYKDIFPLPNLKIQNEYKIYSCKKRTKILEEEINRVENFLLSYQDKFENENNQKIKELFDYIKNIVKYNITTAKTLFNQCKKEQNMQINKKIQELYFLRNELNLFNKKLDELLDLNEKNPLPESQIELDNVYNKLGNFINYENELNLFTMNISIKDEVKNSLFDIIQNAYKLEIDFLKMKNGEMPTIKDLLNKSTNWACKCGNIENKEGTIVCDTCSKYRPLETYSNIIFNPMFLSKTEKKEYHIRRKHELKVYHSLIQKHLTNNNNIKNFYFAIDCSWFKSWKCFITNDLGEKTLPNNEKYISENINLGVLPPYSINNKRISNEFKEGGIYKLKPGLIFKKDYIIVNQLLWEWFLLNYDGGPEIIVENTILYNPYLLTIPEKEKESKIFKKEINLGNDINEQIKNKLNDTNKKNYIHKNENKNYKNKIDNNKNSDDISDILDNDNNINNIKVGFKIKNIMNNNDNK